MDVRTPENEVVPGQNGTIPVRVKFGPRPNQDMPLSWAEGILTKLAAEKPQIFGGYLSFVALGK